MARPGMRGRPVTAAQMAWLLHRSTHLGFPAPRLRSELDFDEWAPGDLAGLLDQVSWAAEPFATTLKVTGVVDGRTVSRHVAVLTVGRMQPMSDPAGGSAVDGDPGPAWASPWSGPPTCTSAATTRCGNSCGG